MIVLSRPRTGSNPNIGSSSSGGLGDETNHVHAGFRAGVQMADRTLTFQPDRGSYIGPVLWHDLPMNMMNVKTATSLGDLKSKLEKL